MTPEQAAADMRERAAKIADQIGGSLKAFSVEGRNFMSYGNSEISRVANLIRALPLPVATPDPRDEALAKAREALEKARMALDWFGGDVGRAASETITAALGDAALTTEPSK